VVLDAVITLMLFAFGSAFLPQPFNETVGVAAIIAVPPIASALLARFLMADDDHGGIRAGL
jgi:hypothetical protein